MNITVISIIVVLLKSAENGKCTEKSCLSRVFPDMWIHGCYYV